MKIHLLSDLHSEMWRYSKVAMIESLVQRADTLVLAGDIAVGRTNVLEMLEIFSPYYENIIYIPGNHEYYHGLSVQDFDHKFAAKLPYNVHFCNPGSIRIDDVEFHTATLWTNFREDSIAENAASRGITDFHRMRNFTTQRCKDTYYQHLEYLKFDYNQRDQSLKQVFVTHFMPAVECIAPRWRDLEGFSSLLNKYFANDLGEWIETLDSCHWLFGHTHDSVDVTIGDCRLLARPLGYPGEHKEPYQPLVIEV